MKLQIPPSLKAEHDELHAILARATREPDPTGGAARAVAALLHPHFVKEEELALPPLALLGPLSRMEPIDDVPAALRLTEKLGTELPKMLAEHRAIVDALEALQRAAREQGLPEYAQFAEKLKLHAQMEEEISYPAAMLVGRYLARSK